MKNGTPAPAGQLTQGWPHAGAQGSTAGDITGQILADHARIRRLFAALGDAARCDDPAWARWMLSEAWQRAAALLEAHCDAGEEICYPALHDGRRAAAARIDDAIADHGDIREAAAEARLQDVGSPAWWRAVTAAITATQDHFAREERGRAG
ncbi:MAG: hemerythrin domain-containing protein [Streptosporangiaceae bacterium]